jgi:hypothetical protein
MTLDAVLFVKALAEAAREQARATGGRHIHTHHVAAVVPAVLARFRG